MSAGEAGDLFTFELVLKGHARRHDEDIPSSLAAACGCTGRGLDIERFAAEFSKTVPRIWLRDGEKKPPTRARGLLLELNRIGYESALEAPVRRV